MTEEMNNTAQENLLFQSKGISKELSQNIFLGVVVPYAIFSIIFTIMCCYVSIVGLSYRYVTSEPKDVVREHNGQWYIVQEVETVQERYASKEDENFSTMLFFGAVVSIYRMVRGQLKRKWMKEDRVDFYESHIEFYDGMVKKTLFISYTEIVSVDLSSKQPDSIEVRTGGLFPIKIPIAKDCKKAVKLIRECIRNNI